MGASLEVVKLLVGAGAKVDCRIGNGTGNVSRSSVAEAACGGSLEVMQYLVEECGADERQCYEGKTPLMRAGESGQADVVEYLMGRPGVDIEAQTPVGETALDLAYNAGRREVVRLLVAAGATIKETGPIKDAVGGGRFQVVLSLVEEAGEDVGCAGPDGEVPISVAAEAGNLDVVETLQSVVSRREHEVSVLEPPCIVILVPPSQ
jgi:ankyrin repeat protein